MQKNFTLLKETTISFPNAFEKGKAGWLFSFWSSLQRLQLNERKEPCSILLVVFSVALAENFNIKQPISSAIKHNNRIKHTFIIIK